MLTTLCKYLNNYFVHDRSAFHFGEFEIEDTEPVHITERVVDEVKPFKF